MQMHYMRSCRNPRSRQWRRRLKSSKSPPPSQRAAKPPCLPRSAKLLVAVVKVAFEDIPSDPTRDNYRQGGTLGEEYKHWFRAKFLQQFRLFFRYQQTEGAKIIVLAWVNDDSTLRAYESANDA